MPSLATLRLIFSIAPWAAILLLLGWGARVNDLRDRWHRQYESEHAARLVDRQSYENAQKQAQLDNQKHVQQIEQRQKEITDDVEKRYQSDLARLRADLAKRLPPRAAAPQRDPGSAAPSQSGPATGEPDGPAWVSIPRSLYVRGAELELQLERLQDWVRQQSAIDPNK